MFMPVNSPSGLGKNPGKETEHIAAGSNKEQYHQGKTSRGNPIKYSVARNLVPLMERYAGTIIPNLSFTRWHSHYEVTLLVHDDNAGSTIKIQKEEPFVTDQVNMMRVQPFHTLVEGERMHLANTYSNNKQVLLTIIKLVDENICFQISDTPIWRRSLLQEQQ